MTEPKYIVKDFETKNNTLKELFRRTQNLDQAKSATEEQIYQEIEDYRDNQKS